MRILHCSDFHGYTEWFNWLAESSADYDLVCLTGDHLDLLNLNWINSQLSTVKATLGRVAVPLALCSGNNDSFSGPPAPANLQHATWLTELRRPGLWVDGDGFRRAVLVVGSICESDW
jgi:predicted phosphodiesterase